MHPRFQNLEKYLYEGLLLCHEHLDINLTKRDFSSQNQEEEDVAKKKRQKPNHTVVSDNKEGCVWLSDIVSNHQHFCRSSQMNKNAEWSEENIILSFATQILQVCFFFIFLL